MEDTASGYRERVGGPAQPHPRGGIVCMLVSCLLLTLNDAATKLLTSSHPVSEIVFMRGAVGVALLLAVTAGQRRLPALRPHDMRFQLYRAGLFVITTTLYTVSLLLLPLPIVTAISFVSPIIMTALAGPLLGEHAGWRRWLAVVVGFAGVALIINPGANEWGWAALVPLACAATVALRDITTRQLAVRETMHSILFITASVTTLAGLSAAPLGGWTFPILADWFLFLFVGASQLAGHFFAVWAFRLSPAVVLAPFKYSMIIWSLALAFLIWNELPTVTMFCGAAIVISSGLYIFNKERWPAARDKNSGDGGCATRCLPRSGKRSRGGA
ncbi:MAG: DMT family transporter [Variibacter sp.]